MDEAARGDEKAAALRLPAVLIGCLVLLIVLGAGFYGWLAHGSAILLSAGETAISWCF